MPCAGRPRRRARGPRRGRQRAPASSGRCSCSRGCGGFHCGGAPRRRLRCRPARPAEVDQAAVGREAEEGGRRGDTAEGVDNDVDVADEGAVSRGTSPATSSPSSSRTTASAPAGAARSADSWDRQAPTTRVAAPSRAACSATWPTTPPAPRTSTLSPACNPAALCSTIHAATAERPSAATSLSSTSCSMATRSPRARRRPRPGCRCRAPCRRRWRTRPGCPWEHRPTRRPSRRPGLQARTAARARRSTRSRWRTAGREGSWGRPSWPRGRGPSPARVGSRRPTARGNSALGHDAGPHVGLGLTACSSSGSFLRRRALAGPPVTPSLLRGRRRWRCGRPSGTPSSRPDDGSPRRRGRAGRRSGPAAPCRAAAPGGSRGRRGRHR